MIASILAQVIEWILSKFVVREVEKLEDDRESESKAKSDTGSLESSKTDAQVSKALDSISKNTFGPGSGGTQ